jgi:predicted secreted protein with PEFG-CTERM motif
MRRSTIVVALAAVLALGAVSVPTGAWAQAFMPPEGMELVAVAEEDSPVVSISGHTIRSEDVIFRILSPSNNLVKADQVTPAEDGTFATSIDVSALTENGLYTIEARQGVADLYNLAVQVNVMDGTVLDTLAVESNFERAVNLVGTDLFDGGIVFFADAMEGSDTITISGQTDITNMHLTIKITAPNGNVISTDQVRPDIDGLFSQEIMIGGPLWSQDGEYTVTAHQGDYETSVVVGIQDGLVVPEFGVMAALILAVAIVSIVAVSARSRLSLVPRF